MRKELDTVVKLERVNGGQAAASTSVGSQKRGGALNLKNAGPVVELLRIMLDGEDDDVKRDVDGGLNGKLKTDVVSVLSDDTGAIRTTSEQRPQLYSLRFR